MYNHTLPNYTTRHRISPTSAISTVIFSYLILAADLTLTW